MNPMWVEEKKAIPCDKSCLYVAAISDQEGKEWCALIGAYVEAGKACTDYKLRR